MSFSVVTVSPRFYRVSRKKQRRRRHDSAFSFRAFSFPLHFLSRLLSAGEHSGATKFVRMDVLTVPPGPAIKGELLL